MTMMSHTVSGRVGGWSVWVWVRGEVRCGTMDGGGMGWGCGEGWRCGRGGLGGLVGAADRVPDSASKLNAYRSQCKVKWGCLYERSECAFAHQPPLTFHWLLYAFNCQ